MLVITIIDNGIGINLSQVNKFGNGLNTMKERLKKLESNLQIDVNNGTKLTFKIKIIS
jgi:signal transduction histidine kinase